VSAPKLHSQSVVKVISEYSSYIKEAPSCTNWYSWFWLFHLCRICMTGLIYPSCVKSRTGRVILKIEQSSQEPIHGFLYFLSHIWILWLG